MRLTKKPLYEKVVVVVRFWEVNVLGSWGTSKTESGALLTRHERRGTRGGEDEGWLEARVLERERSGESA